MIVLPLSGCSSRTVTSGSVTRSEESAYGLLRRFVVAMHDEDPPTSRSALGRARLRHGRRWNLGIVQTLAERAQGVQSAFRRLHAIHKLLAVGLTDLTKDPSCRGSVELLRLLRRLVAGGERLAC